MSRATLPGPREPALDPRTNTFTRPWILFFQQLFERAGGAVSDLLAVSDFTGATKQSLTDDGFQRFPGGLIRQWGVATTGANGSAEITFPTPFLHECFSVRCEETGANGPSAITFAHSTPSKLGVTVYGSGTGTDQAVKSFNWEAVGH